MFLYSKQQFLMTRINTYPFFAILFFLLLRSASGFAINNNPGFENALAGWSTSGSGWTATTSSSKLRTGTYAARLTTAGITLKKLYNTSTTVSVNDNISKFVTFDIYVKSNLLSSKIKLGFYDVTGAIETVDAGYQSADTAAFTKISYTIVGQVGHTYYPVIYASNNVAGSISIYFDDAVISLSTYPGIDNSVPSAPTTLVANCTGTSIQLTFAQGSDYESGTDGIMILRKSGILTDTPSVSNQVYYSSSNSSDGPTSISTWKVIYNDSLISSFTDDPGANGKFTYLVFMRDEAMNYSLSETTGRIFIFNNPTTNYTFTSNAITDGIYHPSGCTIFIKQGVTLQVKNGADIHIYGSLNDSGAFLNNLGGTVTFENGSNYKYCRDGNTIIPIVNATWESNSNCIISGVTNTEPTGTGQTFGNFQWTCSNQATDVDLDASFAANGTFTISQTSSKTLWLNGDTYLKGDLIRTAGNLNYRSNSNVHFEGTSLQNISYTTTFHKLSINNSTGVKISKTITVDSTFYLTDGLFNLNGFSLKIAIGATVSRATGDLSGNPNFLGIYNLIYTAPVTTNYELTSAQTKLNNLTINCNGTITLGKNANVNGILNLIDGIISTGIYEVRTFNSASSTIIGYTSTSYINGILNRSISASGIYDFPVGTSSEYELISLHLNSISGFSSVRGFFNQISPGIVPTGLTVNSTPIIDLLNYGYWTLTPNAALVSGSYDVVCNMHGQSNGPSNANDYCILKREDNTMPWQSLGVHTNNTQSINNGTVTAERTVLNSFSDYGIGFGGVSLPVELSFFKAEKTSDNKVNLVWRTESETNCDSFMVQRSEDGKNFNSIASLKGNGTTQENHNYFITDTEPAIGENYYRLMQKNYNGSYSLSEIYRVNINSLQIGFYPNPVINEMNIKLPTSGKTEITIYNTSGIKISSQSIFAIANSAEINLSNISSGEYFINIKQGANTKTFQFIKE